MSFMQKGQKHTKETRERMKNSAFTRDNTNRIKALPKGKDHHGWTETPNILTLHKRIHRLFGKASLFKCTQCEKSALDWALIGEKYSDNRKDYQPMCRKCHVAMDKGWLKINRSKHKIIRDQKGRIVRTIIT